MFFFQSVSDRNTDIILPGGKVAEFKNYRYQTNDAEIAEALRQRPIFGKSYFEWSEVEFSAPEEKSEPSQAEVPPPNRKRGRPPKAGPRIVTGVRTSELAEGGT